LPLISDLIDSIGKKKVFIKMDLRWEYNSMKIKEGDKWKTAFSMPEGAFKPMVMFFRLTNSLVTFQVMMNSLLRDMIKAGDVAAFIDNIIVGMETKEGYDDIVKEVLKRMAENDLFVKPEKCVWKVRKVVFLGVVIGPDREKEKV